MPIDDEMKGIIAARMKADYAATARPCAPRTPRR
jgi:hypothetical protein